MLCKVSTILKEKKKKVLSFHLPRHIRGCLFQVGSWVSCSDYKSAQPDPLRDFAEKLVNEINTNHQEDVNRFCNVYVDLNFPVSVDS